MAEKNRKIVLTVLIWICGWLAFFNVDFPDICSLDCLNSEVKLTGNEWIDSKYITSNFGPHWSLMRTYRFFFLNEWRDEIKHLSDAENDSDFSFIWAHLAGHNRLLLPTIVFHSTRSHLAMLTAVSLMHVSVIVQIWWRRFGKPKTDMLLILSR